MKINYGIWKLRSRKPCETKNGSLEIEGTWGDDDFHRRIRAEIRRLNPGWEIVGYCPPSPIS